MRLIRGGIIVLLSAIVLAGCGGFGSKRPEAAGPVDPNPYPASYRKEIVPLLTTTLTDRADFRGALIAEPQLKQLPQSALPHYVVCLQFNGRSQRKEKVVVFLAGVPNLFIDAPPGVCAGAPYQPFPELEAALPSH